MGHKRTGVREGSASSILVTFTYKDEPCREFITGQPTSANLKATREWRTDLLKAIDDGSFDYAEWFPKSQKRFKFKVGGGTKFKPFLDEWHESHVESEDLADSTVVTNTGIVNRIGIGLGDLYLDEVTEDAIRNFLKGLRTKKGNKLATPTINNYLAILRPVLSAAARKKLIPLNPLLDCEPIKGVKSKAKEEIDPFAYWEINAILKACEDTPQLHNMIKFAFWTGLRPSELIEVRWDDIKDGKIWIARKRTVYSKAPEAPKTPAGYRTLKLLPEVVNALRDQKKYTHKFNQQIFFNPNTNKPWSSPKIYRDHWIAILGKTSIRYRYPQQTRHTFATMMLGKGEDLMWVSFQMGHESTKETLDTYARWKEDNNPDVGMTAAAAFEYNPELTEKIEEF